MLQEGTRPYNLDALKAAKHQKVIITGDDEVCFALYCRLHEHVILRIMAHADRAFRMDDPGVISPGVISYEGQDGLDVLFGKVILVADPGQGEYGQEFVAPSC